MLVHALSFGVDPVFQYHKNLWMNVALNTSNMIGQVIYLSVYIVEFIFTYYYKYSN